MTGPGAIAGLVMAALLCALLACRARPGTSPSVPALMSAQMTVTTITNRANHTHSLLYTLRGELAVT
jgi:hypothetical protein